MVYLFFAFVSSSYVTMKIHMSRQSCFECVFSIKSYLCTVAIVSVLTLVHKYYINRVSLTQDYIPLKCFYDVFKYSANRFDLGLLNEPIFIIIDQGAAKL